MLQLTTYNILNATCTYYSYHYKIDIYYNKLNILIKLIESLTY